MTRDELIALADKTIPRFSKNSPHWLCSAEELEQFAARIIERENKWMPIDALLPYKTPRPLEAYHEDDGFVLWWKLPVDEPPWVGSPNCSDWPGYHTHWTPIIDIVEPPK